MPSAYPNRFLNRGIRQPQSQPTLTRSRRHPVMEARKCTRPILFRLPAASNDFARELRRSSRVRSASPAHQAAFPLERRRRDD